MSNLQISSRRRCVSVAALFVVIPASLMLSEGAAWAGTSVSGTTVVYSQASAIEPFASEDCPGGPPSASTPPDLQSQFNCGTGDQTGSYSDEGKFVEEQAVKHAKSTAKGWGMKKIWGKVRKWSKEGAEGAKTGAEVVGRGAEACLIEDCLDPLDGAGS